MNKFTVIKKKIQIKTWLDKMGVEKYTINSDFTVDVYGDVNIPGDTAYEHAQQIAEINSNVDQALPITGKTRQELEDEINPPAVPEEPPL